MLSESNNGRVIEFLNHRMNELDDKLARLQHALDRCDECLEADGLRAALHNVDIERNLLHELIMSQLSTRARSFDSTIMQRLEQYRREANLLAQRWQRGRETPPAYWDVDVKQSFLTDLLGRFHAYQDDRSYYEYSPARHTDGDTETPPVFPWFTGGSQADLSSSHATHLLREAIFSALRQNGLSFDHVELFVESSGQVIVIGYAHDEDERQRLLRTISSTAGVRHTVTDIKVVTPDDCPACRAR